jgi:hypothetical protein
MQQDGGASALAWIERSALATAMRQELWLYPSVEIVHIWGFVMLVGSIAMLDLRLLGLSSRVPVRELAGHLLPWTLGALLLIVPSGLMMFIAHATDFVSTPLFFIKMGLILAAGANAALFHTMVFRTADVWDSEEMRPLPPPPSARVSAAASLLLWLAVIACGRLLAYY